MRVDILRKLHVYIIVRLDLNADQSIMEAECPFPYQFVHVLLTFITLQFAGCR